MKQIFISGIILLIMLSACKRAKQPEYPIMPVMGFWSWGGEEFKPHGYKEFVDKASVHSPYTILVQTTRAFEKEVADEGVYQQIKSAVEYARGKGLNMTVDLDVRLARRAFQTKYPDELQEMLILKEIEISSADSVETVVYSQNLHDHYTNHTTNYIPIKGSLLRVYEYELTGVEEIDPGTLRDITGNCRLVLASKDSVQVSIPAGNGNHLSRACVLVSFTHLAADVFAPHLLEFQRDLIHRYADVPAAGVSKDEWGFPPCYDGNPEKNEYWYSQYRAKAYEDRTGGRELLEDCLLMYRGIQGKELERQMAINHFMEMSWQRNGVIDDDFYITVKKVFGPDALVLVHPTWYPYPGLREYKKNGLYWWVSRRDWAQTDELTPFAVRTALAKKWKSPVWYNMYYSKDIHDYERSVWSHALGGGRINYHPIRSEKSRREKHFELLKGDLMQAEARIRLLNYISLSPLDCPIAVIFGHTCTMNWAGPAYDDVGMQLADSLWSLGYPADLIPSIEIRDNSLHIDKDGWICYGVQKYAAVVLYHPEYEGKTTADFFQAAATGKTHLFRMGEWTLDFNGQAFNGNQALPGAMMVSANVESIIPELITTLKKHNIQAQTPASDHLVGFNHISSSPPATGFCRLTDGTVIQLAGTNKVSGDPICSSITVRESEVVFNALGVAAVRLDQQGRVEAIVAGGLKTFRAGDFEINLAERADIALWINKKGKWEGVIQGWEGDIPQALTEITGKWTQLALPIPLLENSD